MKPTKKVIMIETAKGNYWTGILQDKLDSVQLENLKNNSILKELSINKAWMVKQKWEEEKSE